MPGTATVLGEEQPELGANKQEIRVYVILRDRMRRAPFREIARDQRPAATAIVGPQHVGLVIASLVIVDDGVSDVVVVNRGNDVLDQGHVGHTAERLRSSPGLAAIFSDAHHAVIRTDVDQSFFEGALR